MAFSSNSGAGPMADINVTPLVDVMLVLLIIFMVTAPALSYQIQVDLPQRTSNPPPQPKDPPEPIRLRIEAGGTVTWNNSPIPISVLQSSLEVEAQRALLATLTDDAEHDIVGWPFGPTQGRDVQWQLRTLGTSGK